MRPRTVAWAARLALLCLAAACSATPGPAPEPVAAARVVAPDVAASDGRLVIGAVLAATGVLAPDEDVVLTALRAAVAQRNAAGGVGGKPIELLVRDTHSSIVDATAATNELAELGVDVFFVGCDVDIAATASRVARRNDRIAVSSCAADDAFGLDTASNAGFDFAPPSSARAAALAERAINAGYKSAVTVSDLLPYESTNACQRFSARYRELGGTIISDVEVETGFDLAGTVGRIARVGAPSVLVSCLGRNDVGAVLAAVRAAGVGVPMLAMGGADAPPWPGGRVDGVTFVTTAALWPPAEALAPLVAAGATSGPALVTFVALDVVAQVVEAAPDAHGPSLAALLRATTFTTAVGPLHFDERQRAQGMPTVFARTVRDSAESAS